MPYTESELEYTITYSVMTTVRPSVCDHTDTMTSLIMFLAICQLRCRNNQTAQLLNCAKFVNSDLGPVPRPRSLAAVTKLG